MLPSPHSYCCCEARNTKLVPQLGRDLNPREVFIFAQEKLLDRRLYSRRASTPLTIPCGKGSAVISTHVGRHAPARHRGLPGPNKTRSGPTPRCCSPPATVVADQPPLPTTAVREERVPPSNPKTVSGRDPAAAVPHGPCPATPSAAAERGIEDEEGGPSGGERFPRVARRRCLGVRVGEG